MDSDFIWGGEKLKENYCRFCGMNKDDGHQDECFLKAGFPDEGRYLTKRIKATGDEKEDLENSRIILLSKINELDNLDQIEPSREEIAARLVYEDAKNSLRDIKMKVNRKRNGLFGYLKKRREKKNAKKTFRALRDFVEAWEDKLDPNKYIKKTLDLIEETEQKYF
ncbi:hypothetical protein C9439_00250 [archaeon SCG-AAA382B04]|nr:hypothetical protein C9439_00250 [archaeon SCG-AAA382B04]